MKKTVSIVLTSILALSHICIAGAEDFNWSDSNINIAVNDVNIDFKDQKPLVETDSERTYVPVRFLAEQLGAEVDWDQEHQVVIINNKYIEGDNTIFRHYLRLGENKFVTAADYDGVSNSATCANVYYLPEDIYPVIVNDRTMLPFRYVAELLGSTVYYDGSTHTAHCTKEDLSKIWQDGIHPMGVPILSTVIDDYFVDELNKYRKDENGLKNTIYLDGTYSDMAAWASFVSEKDTHSPDYNTKKRLHYNPNTNDMHDMHWFGDKSYATKFLREKLPNSGYEYYEPDGSNNFTYGEIAYKAEDIFKNRTLGNENITECKEQFSRLTQYWGIKINENSFINKKYDCIKCINETVYRKISQESISTWASSRGHDYVMLTPGYFRVGYAIVGNYAYASFY